MIGVEAQKRRGRAEKPWDDPRTGAHRSSGGTARKPAPLVPKEPSPLGWVAQNANWDVFDLPFAL